MDAERSARPGHSRAAWTAAVVAAGALAAALAGCGEPTVSREQPAYDPTQLSDGLVYRWDLGRTVSIYVDRTGEPAGRDLSAAVADAATAWTALLRYREFSIRLADGPAAADVIYHYRGVSRLVDTRGCEAPGSEFAGGYTLFCPDRPEAPVLPLLAGGVEGRVKVDVFVDAAPGSPAEDFQALVTHEMGHVLGIGGHSAEPADVMNPFPRTTVPSAGDARTLRYVLHQAPDIRL
jgi:hypothetical protein